MKLNTLFLSLIVAVAAASAASAEDASNAPAERQKMVEMHEKMSEAHKQTAECLKAGKSVKECHEALAAQCPMGKDGGCAMKSDECPMGRGKGMRGAGRGKGRGMGTPAKPADEKKP